MNMQEDEIQRAKDERLQKQEEEAAKWMSMITKQDEGTGEMGEGRHKSAAGPWLHT